MQAVLPPQPGPVCISYRTRTGALLRVDGVAAGAYDREHHDVLLPLSDRERALTLEVELEALPTNGLPSGPGLIWRFLNARSHQRPQMFVILSGAPEARPVEGRPCGAEDCALAVIGNSLLDVTRY